MSRNPNSIAKEIARELRSGNRLKCFECKGENVRRHTYEHESGKWLCKPHLVELALKGRKDFRSKL